MNEKSDIICEKKREFNEKKTHFTDIFYINFSNYYIFNDCVF